MHDCSRRSRRNSRARQIQRGTVVYSEIEIPTVGTVVEFLDTEGNEVAAMVYESPMFGA